MVFTYPRVIEGSQKAVAVAPCSTAAGHSTQGAALVCAGTALLLPPLVAEEVAKAENQTMSLNENGGKKHPLEVPTQMYSCLQWKTSRPRRRIRLRQVGGMRLESEAGATQANVGGSGGVAVVAPYAILHDRVCACAGGRVAGARDVALVQGGAGDGQRRIDALATDAAVRGACVPVVAVGSGGALGLGLGLHGRCLGRAGRRSVGCLGHPALMPLHARCPPSAPHLLAELASEPGASAVAGAGAAPAVAAGRAGARLLQRWVSEGGSVFSCTPQKTYGAGGSNMHEQVGGTYGGSGGPAAQGPGEAVPAGAGALLASPRDAGAMQATWVRVAGVLQQTPSGRDGGNITHVWRACHHCCARSAVRKEHGGLNRSCAGCGFSPPLQPSRPSSWLQSCRGACLRSTSNF